MSAPTWIGGLRHNARVPAAAPLFQARHLRKRYGTTTVVDDLSFEIARGECLGVIGPNGAGKTTTIRMCLGLTVPDQGSITALGLAMPRDALAIKAQLGVVSQFDTLDPDFSCAENLLVYGRYFGMKSAQIRERIPKLLEFAALSHKADARPGVTPQRTGEEFVEGGVAFDARIGRLGHVDAVLGNEPADDGVGQRPAPHVGDLPGENSEQPLGQQVLRRHGQAVGQIGHR